MATADTPFRTGDIVSLGNFHQDFLSSMLDEDVPGTVTVSRAQALLSRMLELDLEHADFEMMVPFLSDFEALIR
ncbi:hypothetical protein [Janthinobacterium sp.]|uniref:hypothetical protein n=1 Tax=Janthinobacterium sp. TaxID=1871054 RepID=UPI00293D8011|nr:hypothetical protein [Janthinobacterium sp.]